MDYSKLLSERAVRLKPSGIRKFFDLLDDMKDVVALTVGQPDFVTPWHIREAGITSALYLGTKKFGKQIDYAVKEKYSHIIIMGGSELENGIVKVKNLITREENEVKIDQLVSYFNN